MSNELLRGARVAPSILSADFARLHDQVQEVLDAGARIIHVDVMDGHFVPPITVGPLVVEALAEQVRGVGGMLDVHLMVERPERQVDAFARAGAGSITFHAEATAHAARVIELLREHGAGVGIAINPATPVEMVREVIEDVDMVLCMTVNPGWGGQAFIDHSPAKIARLRAMLESSTALEVDGGVDVETAPVCRTAGANILVAGSAIFATSDPGDAYRQIAAAAQAE
jgi:ribulose-phosphate 3-epimerase